MKKLILTALFSTAFLASQAYAGDAAKGQSSFANCIGCHGAAAEGGVGPKLAGQEAAVLADKLHKYKAGEQMGPMTSMMAPMAMGLSDADIDNISTYLSTL